MIHDLPECSYQDCENRDSYGINKTRCIPPLSPPFSCSKGVFLPRSLLLPTQTYPSIATFTSFPVISLVFQPGFKAHHHFAALPKKPGRLWKQGVRNEPFEGKDGKWPKKLKKSSCFSSFLVFKAFPRDTQLLPLGTGTGATEGRGRSKMKTQPQTYRKYKGGK